MFFLRVELIRGIHIGADTAVAHDNCLPTYVGHCCWRAFVADVAVVELRIHQSRMQHAVKKCETLGLFSSVPWKASQKQQRTYGSLLASIPLPTPSSARASRIPCPVAAILHNVTAPQPYESTEDDGVTDSSGFGSSSSDSESLSPDNDDKSTATTTSATATTTKKRSSSTTSAPSSFRSRATGDATSARRGILTTSPTTRGKRLARLGDSCAVTSPRETRASAAAAAAAAAASAATDDHDAAAGGEEQGGASLESGDAKRRKIERPASADIVVSAVGGVQEVMKTASGSIFTASNQDPMSKRFRGKRLSVSGKANGDQRLETSPGGCLTAGQGFGFASLQVETALPGGLDEDLSLATPTFGKGESSGSTVWSTVGDMERADAGSRDGSAGLTGWGVDVTVPSR